MKCSSPDKSSVIVLILIFQILFPGIGTSQPMDVPMFDLPDKQGEHKNPELIIPLPTNSPDNQQDGSLLSIPSIKTGKNVSKQPKTNPTKGISPSIIKIPTNSEIPITNKTNLGNPVPTPPTDTNAKLPVFPKDTSSAIFMVMKSWTCSGEDGHSFLNQVVAVYGQEVEDRFEIKGLSSIPPFNLNLKEEDVTLDELMDSISAKTNLDWGVDISAKTIYFYPGKVQ
ncbi:MAG: hypothetical protein HQM10_17270 [Candidatus Riflebacteria bacterium]|nr:hypothetical protein [Candidatus Riflebacteria bacterium]